MEIGFPSAHVFPVFKFDCGQKDWKRCAGRKGRMTIEDQK
jgi:hypothetical protein